MEGGNDDGLFRPGIRPGGSRRRGHARAVFVITGLDHVVVLVDDIAAGTMAYQTLLAREPAWRSIDDGADRVLFTLDNMTLELMSPHGDGGWPAFAFAPAISRKCIAGLTGWC
jgi:hypothetical protein